MAGLELTFADEACVEALADEKLLAAMAHFEAALEMNSRMGARPWLAHTQADYAELLLQRGEQSRALVLLAQAGRTYDELGMPRGAERVALLGDGAAAPR